MPWQCFFWQNFTKFKPEKYDFDLYKTCSMKEMAQIFPRSEDFYDKFQ
jgi:hypothetical protein